MHRSVSYYTSTRYFSYTTTLQPNYVLDRLSLLSTSGHLHEALSFFYNAPIHFQSHQAYAILFHECSLHRDITQGLHLHRHLLSRKTSDPPPDVFLTNHVINMYAKCGYLQSARKLFDEMPERNLVSWTALLSGYAQRGCPDDCFKLFSGMLAHFRPNEFALTSLLSWCGYLHGQLVHALALKMGLDASVYVKNALIGMYGKSCGCINEAWSLFNTMEFRNLVSWNSMITSFQSLQFGLHGVNLFTLMHRDGIAFDRATLLSVMSSLCGIVSGLKLCLQLHCLIAKTGFTAEIEVASALVKAYSGLGGDVDDCYRLFMETSCCRDIISWTGIITAFADQDPVKALFLFGQLLREELTPDRYTFSIVLKACASLVTPRHTSAIHSQVIKSGFADDLVLNNSLIHAYSRSGSIALSKQVFEEMGFRDLVSWNSMLKACALHGQAKDALMLFSRMDVVKPDSATFVAILSACSHSGLVEEGSEVFESMLEYHGTVPQLEHYACMVDILGRAGRIDEAKGLINKMPMEPDSVIWSALLGSCRKHGETQLAKLAAEKMKELEPNKSLSYVQMANIFNSGGSFNEAGQSRKEMKGLSVRKQPGLSWIEIGNQVHEFASGGWRHPQRDVICSKLEQLMVKLKEIGYVPQTCLALCDIEEEQKEEHLLYHSEKLALAYLVLLSENTSVWRGSCIQIMKNIRICVDCHNFMKLASNLLWKEIVVRDSNRFHHFKNRVCSCNDYW